MTPELKNIDYWERILKDPPKSYKEWFWEEERYLQDNITENSKVLEVGCGGGRTLKNILQITKNLTGIDNDENAIKSTKNSFEDYLEVKILLADAEKLPFGDNSFDFVVCINAFYNLGSKKFKALDEMKRVVNKEGFIIISVYSEDAFEERRNVYKKIGVPIKEIKGTTIIFEESVGANVSEQFSEKELREIFDKVKLNLIEIKKLNMAYICKLKK